MQLNILPKSYPAPIARKVVLVHGKYFNSWEALGLGLIGAYIKKHCPTVQVDFFQGCFDPDDEIVNSAVDADIVFFSCTSPTFPYCLRLAAQIKRVNPTVHTVVGGYHPSATPETCIVPGIDQAVVGEGEAAAVEIINGNRETILHARRLTFDEIVWADRDLIKNHRNIQVAYNDTKKRITSFQSSRSCPFSCQYCLDGATSVLYGKKVPVNRRSVEDLVSEMIAVCEKYQLDLMKFSDATWNTNKEVVKEFCKEKIARGLRVPFQPNIHARVVDDEMFELMAAAGCYEIAVGVESGSPKILKQIGKNHTREHVLNCVTLAKKHNIRVRGYFILGMPEETEEDLALTQDFAEQLELDEYGFTILCPYPGTVMYNTEPQRFADVDWEQTDEYSNDFWGTKTVSNKQLKIWQRKLTERFRHRITWHNKVLMEKSESHA